MSTDKEYDVKKKSQLAGEPNFSKQSELKDQPKAPERVAEVSVSKKHGDDHD